MLCNFRMRKVGQLRYYFAGTGHNLLLAALLFAYSAGLALVYRVALSYQIHSLYNADAAFLIYSMQKGAVDDFLLSLMIGVVYFIIIQFVIRRRRVALFSGLLLLAGFGAAFVGLLAYFAIFEAPFHTAIFGADLGTFQTALVTSAVDEISFEIFLKAFYPLIISMAFAVFFTAAYLKKPHLRKAGIWLGSLILLFMFIQMARGFFRSSGVEKEKSFFSFPAGHLIDNPIWLLGKYPFSSDETAQTDHATVNTDSFSYGLNTDSLVSEKTVPGIRIPRRRDYNIVFYLFESTPAQYLDMKYKGRDLTPNWKKLSENAVVFKNHYAHFPLSINTFFTVLTSAYEHHSKRFIPCSDPDLPLETLYEILHKEGFTTSIMHGSTLENFCRNRYLKNRKVDLKMGYKHFDHSQYPPINKGWQADDRVMIQPAVDFLKREKPGFLMFMPISPHHPYDVPSAEFEITADELEKPLSRRKRYLYKYMNTLYYSDYILGEFVKALKDAGLFENTILFVFSDHGEAFYQHKGNYLHSLFIYEENTHVPFIIYNSEIFREPVTYEGVSRNIDIPVSVLDLLNLPRREYMEGGSLLKMQKARLAYLHAQWRDDIIGLRDGPYKYMLRVKDGAEELYNIENDPGEKKNIAGRRPELLRQFREYVRKARDYKIKYFRHVKKQKRKNR